MKVCTLWLGVVDRNARQMRPPGRKRRQTRCLVAESAAGFSPSRKCKQSCFVFLSVFWFLFRENVSYWPNNSSMVRLNVEGKPIKGVRRGISSRVCASLLWNWPPLWFTVCHVHWPCVHYRIIGIMWHIVNILSQILTDTNCFNEIPCCFWGIHHLHLCISTDRVDFDLW